jgi:hypothetical protein
VALNSGNLEQHLDDYNKFVKSPEHVAERKLEGLSARAIYDGIIGFIPTGWADAPNWNKKMP